MLRARVFHLEGKAAYEAAIEGPGFSGNPVLEVVRLVEEGDTVMAELGGHDIAMIGVAKGTTRKAGFETLFNAQTGAEIVLPGDSPALHLIQHIRDEAHRFAITGHKQRRDKKRKTSTLEDVPGIGAGRRRELLRHFGGLPEIRKASVNDLAKVQGISQRLAEEIYSFFHND